MSLAAVVFDFDGLMMDSEWVIYESARAAFRAHDHDLSVEAWAGKVGTNDDDDPTGWDRLCQAAGVVGFERDLFEAAYRDAEGQDARRATMSELPVLPGVEALVHSLTAAGVPLGVASSSSTGWLERNLDRFGLRHHFGTLVGSDRVGGSGKPAPDVYRLACAELAADPARSVALEDSAHGVTAARAAGMRAVAVPSRITRWHDFDPADLVVASLTDLDLDALQALVAPV